MSNEFSINQRDISCEQLMEYIKLIGALPALYRNRPRNNRDLTMNAFWDTCARKLNAIKGGALKSATGWSKYLHYVRFRVKQRIVELTKKRKNSIVPEDDYIPISEVDRIINRLIDASDDQGVISYEFDPTNSRYWKACAPQPAATLKRRLSESDIVITKRSEEDIKDKNAKGPAGERGRKRERSTALCNCCIKVPAIRRRSQSFTDMSDMIEYDRKLKLEMIAERTKTDPVSVQKRESERIEYVYCVSVMLRACLIDSLFILSFTSLLKQILKNNPQFKKTISITPIIF